MTDLGLNIEKKGYKGWLLPLLYSLFIYLPHY